MKSVIHKDEFPREKLIKREPEALADYKLLAIILNTGTKKENVIELSKRIETKYQLQNLCNQSVSQLTKELGLGKAKACKILAISELVRRINIPEESQVIVKNAKDVAKVLIPKIAHKNQENLVAVFLKSRKKIISIKTLFIGKLNESLVHPREILKSGLEENAAAIIIAHNHSSQDPTPSSADITFTKELVSAGEIIGIEVLDHIIITKDAFYSLHEQNLC